MNKTGEQIYNVGDLIQLVRSDNLGLVVDREASGLFGEFMYKIHFCGEDNADGRWIFSSNFQIIMR